MSAGAPVGGVDGVVGDDTDEEVVCDEVDGDEVPEEEVVEALDAGEAEGDDEGFAPLPPLLLLPFFGSALASHAIRLSLRWDGNECGACLFTMFEITGVSVTGTGQEPFTQREFADVTLLRRRVSITIWADWTRTGIPQPVPTCAC